MRVRWSTRMSGRLLTKIHFDCSEGCAGEAVQVGDAVSAGRAGKLAAVCQRAASDPGSLN